MIHTRPMFRAALIVVACSLLFGCASNAIHPGARNATDSQMYDSLATARAALASATANISQFPNARPLLIKVLGSYNVAADGYALYHAGKTADAAALELQITAVLADLAILLKSMGVTATPLKPAAWFPVRPPDKLSVPSWASAAGVNA